MLKDFKKHKEYFENYRNDPENKKKQKERDKLWYEKNKEKKKEYRKRKYQEDKLKIKEYKEKTAEELEKEHSIKYENFVENEWVRRLKNNYNLSKEEYFKILEEQNGKCAICSSDDPGSSTYSKLCVDHCHKTNKIRGLLCFKCNTSLGKFGDNVEFLKKAIKYLEK